MGTRTAAAGVILFLASAATLAQAGSDLSGTVRDGAGQPMPGILVEVSSPDVAGAVRPVATDARGRYRFVRLPPGTYSISFTLIGFWTERREGIQHPNRSRRPLNVRLYGDGDTEPPATASDGASLTGTVFDAVQGGIPSVAVSLTGPATRATTSDMNGQFSYTGLPAGDYELRASLEGFATTVRRVTLAADARRAVRIEMSVGGPPDQLRR
jgi:hypothetical protein